MNLSEIKNEFKDYKLTEEQAIAIFNLYKSAASLIAVIVPIKLASNQLIIKITLNLIKLIVVQIFELKEGLSKNGLN